jgi:hypothetical protein
MPLFIDHHMGVEGLTAEAAVEAHKKDLEVQDNYGVKYHRYCYNKETGEVCCLAEAPNSEAVEPVHRPAAGIFGSESHLLGRLFAPKVHGLVGAGSFTAGVELSQANQRRRVISEHRNRVVLAQSGGNQ